MQAAKQLDSNWTLQKVGVSGVLDWDSYLEQVSAFLVPLTLELTRHLAASSCTSELASVSIRASSAIVSTAVFPARQS